MWAQGSYDAHEAEGRGGGTVEEDDRPATALVDVGDRTGLEEHAAPGEAQRRFGRNRANGERLRHKRACVHTPKTNRGREV
jgi:hypothetical protein